MLAAPVIEKTKMWVIAELMMREIYKQRAWTLEDPTPILRDPSPQEELTVPILEPPTLKKEPRVSTFWMRKLGNSFSNFGIDPTILLHCRSAHGDGGNNQGLSTGGD